MTRSYQDVILGKLSALAEGFKLTPTTAMNFANTGKLVVLDGLMKTVVTLSFDFQHDRVQAVINHEGRGVLAGPRDATHFWWTIGKPEDDDEVARLMRAWNDKLREGTKR